MGGSPLVCSHLFVQKLFHQKTKVRKTLIRAGPSLYKLSDYPSVSLKIVDGPRENDFSVPMTS